MQEAATPSAFANRNFGLVASRISKMMIHVAEANGISRETMCDPRDLISSPLDLVRDDSTIPWQDLTVLADRVSVHFQHNEEDLKHFGRCYYQHLEHLPYTRLASTILTLRGALYLAQRYTTPHNYEALSCTSQWLSRSEGVKTNRLKYPNDPHSQAICHITFGVLELFPTLFGRDPMKSVDMEIRTRDVSYHFTLPPPIGFHKFILRSFESIKTGENNWKILRDQEVRLLHTQRDARRRRGILDELLSQAPQPLALLENDKPVFLNRALSVLLGGETESSRIAFPAILTRLRNSAPLDRTKFSIYAVDGTVLPLEAILSARIGADSFGSEMTLLRFRDRRLPETREEAVTLAREQERANFSQNLHDGLGQTLSGIAYRVSALRQSSPNDHALVELEQGISTALTQARTIAHNKDFYCDLPLLDRLRLTTDGFSGLTNIPIAFDATIRQVSVTGSFACEIDMILREALANAVRHSTASEISVRLIRSGNELVLEVSDNGAGLPKVHLKGFGMNSILSRTRALHGSARWLDTRPGTLLRCSFPLTPP